MSPNPRAIAARVCLTAVVLVMTAPAPAVSAQLSDYTMRSWSRRDGVPGPVWSICQDLDGYLWVGTGAGLLRFDGYRFVAWESLGYRPLPSGSPILALLSANDGSLWIGAGQAGIGRLLNGVFTLYRDPNGLAYTRTLVEDSHGTVWAGSPGGLFQFDGKRWIPQRESVGLPAGPNSGIYEDPADRLWVQTLARVYRRPSAGHLFEAVDDVPTFSYPPVPLEARAGDNPNGRIWNPFRARQDHRGDIWLASVGQGLSRLRFTGSTARLEQLTTSTGLSSNVVGAVYEDRESNVWIGTQAALDELTPRKVTPVDDLGAVAVVAATDDGSTWVGSDKGLIRLTKDHRYTYTERNGLPPGAVQALCTDTRGRLWIATIGGLAYFSGTRIVPVPMPQSPRLGRIIAMSVDSHETVWLTYFQFGIVRVQNGTITPLDTIVALDQGRVFSAYVDRKDRVWIGFADGRLGLLEPDGRVLVHDLGITGAVGSITEDNDGVLWIGGEDGIARFANGTSIAVTTRTHGFPGFHVTGIIVDARAVWAGTNVGIVRVDRGEFDRIASASSHQVQYTLVDESDGLRGMPVHLAAPAAARAQDGRLWFVTDGGVTFIDPSSLSPSRRVPRVRIEEVRAAGRRFDSVTGPHIPPRPERVEIDYTALTFSSPTSVHFRYRLSGFDSEWQDAGPRRQASYTNLPPGRYTFQVIASDKDGAFDPSGAIAAFVIEPAFEQSSWFLLAVAAVILGAGTAVWQIRVRQIRARFAAVLAERARISREVHDTLLQSLVGVSLRSGTIAERLPASDLSGARAQLDRMRKDVEEQIREARQTIWNLRSPSLHERGLAGAIQDVGNRIARQTSAGFAFSTVGQPQPCAAVVEEQLLRIAQEALINAGRHSHAADLRVELRYQGDAVTLHVIDNGVGFDSTATRAETHFGLTQLRERAAQVGGHLDIVSTVGGGTTVIATIPVHAQGAA